MNKTRLVLIALLFALTLSFVPPSLYAQEYLLFTAPMGGTNGQAYRMDAAGSLTLRETFTVNVDPYTINISPDGRTVVYDAHASSPTLCVVFVKPDGRLRPPVFLSDGLYWVYPPLTFHSDLPLFYTGLLNTIKTFRYDYQSGSVEQVGESPAYGPGAICGYSPWAGCLIYYDVITNSDEIVIGGKLGSVRPNADGSFGSPGPLLTLPCAIVNGDMTVSPDGRWAALSTCRHPSIMLVRIGSDGEMALADTVDFVEDCSSYLCFSPNSQNLYVMDEPGLVRTNDGVDNLLPAILTNYRIDLQSGKLSQAARLPIAEDSYYAGEGTGLTVTPDGRFLAFRSNRLAPVGHNWINVVRIAADGQFEYLKDKQVEVDHYLNDLAFTWLPQDAAGPQWALYE